MSIVKYCLDRLTTDYMYCLLSEQTALWTGCTLPRHCLQFRKFILMPGQSKTQSTMPVVSLTSMPILHTN